MTDAQLCSFLGSMTTADSNAIYSYLNGYNLENLYEVKNIGKVSGLNLL